MGPVLVLDTMSGLIEYLTSKTVIWPDSASLLWYLCKKDLKVCFFQHRATAIYDATVSIFYSAFSFLFLLLIFHNDYLG